MEIQFPAKKEGTYYSRCIRRHFRPAAVTGCRGCREEQALHCLACKLGLASDVVLATALLARYGKRSLLADAQMLFDEMPRRDGVAFNAMLAALGASGRTADARRLFDRMPETDRTPASWNTVLTCYCRAGDLASAREVFEGSLRANMSSVVSWNAMINGYWVLQVRADGRCPGAVRPYGLFTAGRCDVEHDDGRVFAPGRSCRRHRDVPPADAAAAG